MNILTRMLLGACVALLLNGAGAASLAAAEPPPLTLAVFDFDARDPGVSDLGPKISTLLNATLSAEPNLVTVERAELAKALGEQELSLSGTVSPESAAKVGHLTGAKVLVTGRVFLVDQERVIVAKVIGAETSRVFGEISRAPATGSLTAQLAELGAKIAATVRTRGDSLVARVLPRAERVERLRAALKEAKLPAVSVRIPEQHFGQPVRDPAAQTELLAILQQCGFPIVDETSKRKADIEITGEAFSAVGLRKGNLITCKARVEIKANGVNPPRLITVERQTSVAVDITEPTAAKFALENAAVDLAERLVPRLISR